MIAENFAPNQWLSWPRSSVRVVDWNIDRGLKLPAIIDFLGDLNADILLLQEVDINARRTHKVNVAQEVARKLRLNYAFGREFVELTQGSKPNPAYHGQSTLSKWRISNPRIIHFQQQSEFWKPRWFKPKLATFQERLGGRIALAAEINTAAISILTYNLHLESRGDDQLRCFQLDEVLDDARRYNSNTPILLTGDLNLDVSDGPAAAAIGRAEFLDAFANQHMPTTPGSFLEHGRTIDWVFTRGPIRAGQAQVHRSVSASDHYPQSVKLKIG